MFVEKDFLGSMNVGESKFYYYLLKKDIYYGIELAQETQSGLVCKTHYFTENYDEAYQLVMKMKDGQVTLVTMNDILDDFIQ
ncbi:MAG: DUF6514 family protein [Cellulosilyticaceae bacterium]